jgi:xanthine dehydrogenase YagS FAD-binding subunit
MNPFQYERASDVSAALTVRARAGAQYLGGGTNLVDLMRETIEHPDVLVDVTGLSRDIEETKGGGLKIGAGVKNTAVAADRRVRERFPLLAQAILAGASAQIRNMATVGGNLMQRTRCLYFYDDAARCNKRVPGEGCDARDGFHRNHAVLGASEACVATHPSDMCVALVALDAVVTMRGNNGSRDIPLTAFHRLPGDTPQVETVLEPGELIIAVTVPPNGIAARSHYRKVRDRASHAFARLSRSPPASRWRPGGSRTCASPWAAWPTSRGAPSARKPRFGAARRPRPPSVKQRRLNSLRLSRCATMLSRLSSPRG